MDSSYLMFKHVSKIIDSDLNKINTGAFVDS